jgi:hypothetical protein
METLDRKALRLMIMEALDEISCGTDEGSGCMDEDDLDEFSGGAVAGAVAGYTLPLGMRPSGPRRDTVNVARRSFGGLGKKRKKR